MGSSFVCFFSLCSTLMLARTYGQGTEVAIDDNELGMGTLFDMVNIFTGDVLHKKRISESFLNLSSLFEGGKFHSEQMGNWKDWAEYLIGFAVCAAIGIVFIVGMPIAGLIFCCCRLCGRCGAKSEKSKMKRAKCKRRCYCTVLIILTTITLVGAICAFICNSIVYKHLQNDNNEGSFGHINHSLYNIQEFINNSFHEYSSNVSDTYKSTSREILSKVNASATDAVTAVIKSLNVESLLASATNISKVANETKQKLDNVSKLLSNLSIDSGQLKDNLTQIIDILNSTCAHSTINKCSGVNPADYDTDIDFSNLDRLSSESSKVSLALDMYKYIVQANESLVSVKQHADDSVKTKVTEAEDAVNHVQDEIDKGINDLETKKNQLLRSFPNLDSVSHDVKEYSKYVYYGGIGVCCVYLLVVALYLIGLLFGLCGERPGDGAPCCNTGCGARFLLSGVAFTFLLSWILMIVCVVLFCVGGPAYTEVCRYFQGHDPSQFKAFDGLVNEALDLKSYYKDAPPEVSISNILQNCKENKALFSALQLDYIIDLNKTLNISQLESKLQDLKNANFTLEDIAIINSNLTQAFMNFVNSGIDKVNFSHYYSELSKQLTVGDLSQMALVVENMAKNENDTDLRNIFNDSAIRLLDLHNNALPGIKAKVSQLNATLMDLDQQSPMKGAVQSLIDNLNDTQTNFNANKTVLIRDKIIQLADDIFKLISEKIDTLKHEVRETLCPCKDLSTAVFTMSDAVCIQIIEPVNGFWFSFGWCLFFFVPCLIFAVLLADQYRRTLEDDKEFDDPNYMMYGNPNPDTIPLTRVDNTPASRGLPRSGMYNAGYREEYKRGNYAEPPPYDAHMQPGIAAYAAPVGQHQRQAKAYAPTHVWPGDVPQNRNFSHTK